MDHLLKFASASILPFVPNFIIAMGGVDGTQKAEKVIYFPFTSQHYWLLLVKLETFNNSVSSSGSQTVDTSPFLVVCDTAR